MKAASLFEHVLVVVYALDGQIYVAPDGGRLEVVNIRGVRRLLQMIFAAGLLAAVVLIVIGRPLFAVAAIPSTAVLVFATLLWTPKIKRTEGEPKVEAEPG